tara:strand:+ start:43719 stop:47630 length:3912 start_codon:yes stop_codon:yes gene_type:complete
MSFSADQVASRISQCFVTDRKELLVLSQRITRRLESDQPTSKDIYRLDKMLAQAQKRVEARRKLVPSIDLVADLPISEHAQEIADLLDKNQVIVVAGETGSGKTTQLPKICLNSGRGVLGRIAHTQPRRVAARIVGQRIAKEIGTNLGELVGYQVRFSDQSGPDTLLKLMTDGILLAEIQRDPELLIYDTIIVDEAHERSLNIDFLLGYLKGLLPRRQDLKIIITSATIDLQRFSEFFDGAPILEVSGRTYPVKMEYLPAQSDSEELLGRIQEAVHHCLQSTPPHKDARDILVFLSGEREIRETAKKLRDTEIKGLEVLPLYSRLSIADQDKVFRSGGRRRVVLATNVAETSITVPGIGFVIDPGFARISRFNARTQIQRLPIEAISQASANQRAGRSGRVAPGHCLRLYSEEDFLARPKFTDPEILRTNLSAVILRMAALNFGDIRNFPFIEPPDARQINAGIRQLQELELLKADASLTAIGLEIAKLPVDPQFGRMLWEARFRYCLKELLIIVSALTVQDARERPTDKRQQADEKHRKFHDEKSDFIAYLNIWKAWENERQSLTNRQLRSWCERNFLSFIRMREWRDIHRQLRILVKEQNWKENQQPAQFQQIHESLLTGLLSHIGFRRDNSEYLGARNRVFRIFPGSSLFKQRPKWIVAGEMIETSQLFAHQVAAIEPEWLEPLAVHLIQDEYLEPEYSSKRGEVTAQLRRTLFGLLLRDDQRVSYKKVDPAACHQIFVREALANGRYRGAATFLKHNKKVIRELEELQERARRSDLSPSEEDLYDFYASRVDAEVLDHASFDSWHKKISQDQPERLFLDRDKLLQRAELNLRDQFPDRIQEEGQVYQLRYQFDPNAESDGVTAEINLESLQSFPLYLGEWLVPGMLEEKVSLLLRSLPKKNRRSLLPIGNKAQQFALDETAINSPLTERLCNWLVRTEGEELSFEDFDSSVLPNYFLMNYALVGDKGERLEQTRDLVELKNRYRQHAEAAVETLSSNEEPDLETSQWDFGKLDEYREIRHQGHALRVWLGIEDIGSSVRIRSFSTPLLAAKTSRRGLARLYCLSNKQAYQYLSKELFNGKALQLISFGHSDKEALVEEVIFTSISDCFDLRLENVRTRSQFEQELEKGRAELVPKAMELEKLVLKMAQTAQDISSSLLGLTRNYQDLKQNIADQMQYLLCEGVLFDTQSKWRSQLPRYLTAIQGRLQKLESRGFEPDAQASLLVDLEWQRYLQLYDYREQDNQRDWPELDTYRWMIEEYRISLFAQPMKTFLPVSKKRLDKLVLEMEKSGKNFLVHAFK